MILKEKNSSNYHKYEIIAEYLAFLSPFFANVKGTVVEGGLDLWGKQMMSPLGVGLPPSLLLILTPCMLLSPLCLVQSHSNKVLIVGSFYETEFE